MAGETADGHNPTYDHSQTANHAVTAFVVLSIMLLISIVIGAGGTGALLVVVAFLVFVGVIMFAFNKMHVTVDDDEVYVRFRWGWPERRYALGEVHRIDVVRNKWWYGFGIRLTPHGWMYNVWGLDAVQLNFHDGKAFRIGSDEPARLAAALGHDPAG
jgi:hypothetical protein